MIAPIALFAYKKLEPLQRTITALKANRLAASSDLIIFSDGAAKPSDEDAVAAVRVYLKTVSGFKTVTLREAEINKGLAKSIIEGVSDILRKHESIIVLEDDLLSSTNFLEYMNAALTYYSDYNAVFSIAGYTPLITAPSEYSYDTYFTLRASSWGWATWKKQWETVDWEVSSFDKFESDRKAQRKFNQMGSDMTRMLTKQLKGKSDSWAIRWCFHQFQKNLFTVFPINSKIQNIGFVAGATNTKGKITDKRFATPLDNGNTSQFLFCPSVGLNSKIIKQFVVANSIKTRLYYKVRNFLGI